MIGVIIYTGFIGACAAVGWAAVLITNRRNR